MVTIGENPNKKNPMYIYSHHSLKNSLTKIDVTSTENIHDLEVPTYNKAY